MSTTFTATIENLHHTINRATVRTHSFIVDRSPAKGGFDVGPIGGEFMLVSLGGCFTTHLMACARAREAPLTNVRVAVTGTLDGSPERFTAFTLDVAADCPDPDLARKLIVIAGRSCQVVTTLRQVAPVAISYAGSPVEYCEQVTVA